MESIQHDAATRAHIGRNLERINEDLHRAASRSGRSVADVTVVAVSKTVD